MIRLKQPTILNSKGEKIVLDAREQYSADLLQRQVNEKFSNSLGYEVSITTLTTIMKRVAEQKFFEVAPADYLPVKVGEGAWSSNLLFYRSFDLADEFETGIVNVAGQNARLASADAAVDSLSINVKNWAKTIGWSIMELEMAAKSGNWDIVSAKEKSRKRNFDLGVQRIAFLGARGSSDVLGLLNQTGITTNTTTITAPISGLSVTDLKAFVVAIVEKYRSNCARTAMPNRFVVPESDFNGMAAQASSDFPILSVKKLLEDAFKEVTGKQDFRILPLAYADSAYNSIGKQCYCLLNHDEESLVMNIPVNYTNTLANTLNNFQFESVGYAQFTGVQVIRPLEMIYFQY